MSYRKILVGVDGSETSQRALAAATDLAAGMKAQLFIISAHDSVDQTLRDTEKLVEQAVRSARDQRVSAKGETVVGRPADVIVTAAEDHEVDLVVVGNRGMTGSARFLLGSVPDAVSHHSPCDLLIVQTVRPRDGSTLFSKILIATDGSPSAEQAARQGFDLAETVGAEVLLLYAGFPQTAEIILTETVARMAEGVPTETRAVSGDPAALICDVAESENASLIVIGNKGMSGAKRFLLGSVPNKVSHHSPCDLLIVRTDVSALDEIQAGEGGIVEMGGAKQAVYRDDSGGVTVLSPVCTHLGCTVGWNASDKTWDCPCHGSRFSPQGEVVRGPASKPLKRQDYIGPSETSRPPNEPQIKPRAGKERSFVIIGGGLTGSTAALRLRSLGFDGRLVLIGGEGFMPYERPFLSKGYLRGEQRFPEGLVAEPPTYADQQIELRIGQRAERIDPRERTVMVGHEEIPYDALLVATGGRPRRPPIEGIELEGVITLRTVEDADAIRGQAKPGAKVAIVGMGFIGAEVAASLRSLGLEVTALEGRAVPLEGPLGTEIGSVIGRRHMDEGVRLITQDAVDRFVGSTKIEAVETKAGTRIECDFAVVGLGIEPILDIFDGTEVVMGNGVQVDELCRTSVEGIFAAGDIAEHLHPLTGTRMRIEHWQHARQHGAAAASAMLGQGAPYDEVHWFWSDQYDMDLQYAGFHLDPDDEVVDGDIASGEFALYRFKAGRLMACIAMNRAEEVARARTVIAQRKPVEPDTITRVLSEAEPTR